MYYGIVALFMFLLPVGFAIGESVVTATPLSAALVLRWFVFWSVGVRLLSAGVRQIAQPRYTAESILGLKSDDALVLVRELGFANVAIGAVGVASIAIPGWAGAAGLAGAIFYLLAGGNHLLQGHRNRLENVAMVSDSFVGVVLAGALVLSMVR